MANDRKVVATGYTDHHKVEIVKTEPLIGNPKYYRREDGKVVGGTSSSAKKAVEAAKEKGAEF